MTAGIRLISSPPSPYARKVRIALAEKQIPFELVTEVPWDSTTQTPAFNPLEKLPILLVPGLAEAGELSDSGLTPVYESHYILEWLEMKYPTPSLLPHDIDQRLLAKQIEVVCDGVCDALILRLFERMRAPEKQSPDWLSRQQRKVDGGIKWLNDRVQRSEADGRRRYLIDEDFGLADIAAGAVLGYVDVRAKDVAWKSEYPALKTYFEGLMDRPSFQDTVPYASSFKDRVV